MTRNRSARSGIARRRRRFVASGMTNLHQMGYPVHLILTMRRRSGMLDAHKSGGFVVDGGNAQAPRTSTDRGAH